MLTLLLLRQFDNGLPGIYPNFLAFLSISRYIKIKECLPVSAQVGAVPYSCARHTFDLVLIFKSVVILSILYTNQVKIESKLEKFLINTTLSPVVYKHTSRCIVLAWQLIHFLRSTFPI
jgi:hypothetical protein